MSVIKVRNDADDAWIELGGGVKVYQQTGEPVTTYPGMLWLDTDAESGISFIEDDDGDTKIQCEETADEDKIRLDCGGTEVGYFQSGDNQVFTVTGRENSNIHAKSTVDTAGCSFKVEDSTGALHGFGAYGRSHATKPSMGYIYNFKGSKFMQEWTEDGEVTFPNQVMFCCGATGQTNLATATDHTVQYDATEIWDVGANYNTTTYTFTAPVDGKYLLIASLFGLNADDAGNYYRMSIVTSNRTWYRTDSPGRWDSDPAYWHIHINVIADMDASDTAHVTIRQQAGTAQFDTSGNDNESFFSGQLLG